MLSLISVFHSLRRTIGSFCDIAGNARISTIFSASAVWTTLLGWKPSCPWCLQPVAPEDEYPARPPRVGPYLTLLRGIAFERENVEWADRCLAVLAGRDGLEMN
jgi:hypothetical protein